MKSSLWAGAAAIVSGAAFSACCWLPALAIVLGFSAGGAAAVLDRYRWIFLILSVALLGLGFYLNERPVEACAPDGSCPEPRPWRRRLTRIALVISSILVVLLATLPNYADRLMEWALEDDETPTAGAAVLVRLSSDASELRRDFNGAKSQARLVLLLSPT